MKKLLITLAILLLPNFALAQVTIPGGGTGWATSTPGDLLVGTTSLLRYSRLPIGTGGFVLQSSSTSPFKMNWVSTTTLGFTGGGGGGSGTVTSVDFSTPTGLTISGNPITTAGTLALSLTAGYNIPLTSSTTKWDNLYNGSTTLPYVTSVTRGIDHTLTCTGLFSITCSIDLTNVNGWSGMQTFAGGLNSTSNFNFTGTGATANNILIAGSPSNPSVVLGSTSVSRFPNTTVSVFGIGTQNPFAIGTGTTQWFTVASSSNIGVGTTSPSNKLEVAGNGYFVGNLTATGTITAGTLLKVGSVSIADPSNIYYPEGTNTKLADTTGTLYYGNPGSNVPLANGSNDLFVPNVIGSVLATDLTGKIIATTTSGGGGGTPGGASSTIQFNANGAFAGNSTFVYTGSRVGIGSTTPASTLGIVGTTTISQGLTVLGLSQATIEGPLQVDDEFSGGSGVVIGQGQNGSGQGVNIGNNTSNGSFQGITVGSGSISGTRNMALGLFMSATGATRSTMIGFANTADSSTNSTVIGYENQVMTASSTAIGSLNNITNNDSTAIGASNTVSASGAQAFGNFITNSIASSTMIGPNNTSKMTLKNGGQIVYTGSTPSFGSCGTSPTVIGGNDNVGRIKTGSGLLTSCVVNFANSWSNPPICIANTEGGIGVAVNASSTVSSVTFSNATSLSGDVVTYQCFGY